MLNLFTSIQRWYNEHPAVQWLAAFVKQYGISFFIADLIVGTSTFLVCLILLLMADVQPLQIANWLHLKEDSVWRTWIKDYGVFAAAFVIMKLLFPMRLALEIVLTRLIHGTVNRNVQPVWDRVCGFCGWTGEEGDDEGGEGSGEGREMLGLHSYKEIVEDEDHVLLAGEASEDVETLVATERNSWNSHVGRASSPTSRFRHSSQE